MDILAIASSLNAVYAVSALVAVIVIGVAVYLRVHVLVTVIIKKLN